MANKIRPRANIPTTDDIAKKPKNANAIPFAGPTLDSPAFDIGSSDARESIGISFVVSTLGSWISDMRLDVV
jgi:hypothetical protein